MMRFLKISSYFARVAIDGIAIFIAFFSFSALLTLSFLKEDATGYGWMSERYMLSLDGSLENKLLANPYVLIVLVMLVCVYFIWFSSKYSICDNFAAKVSSLREKEQGAGKPISLKKVFSAMMSLAYILLFMWVFTLLGFASGNMFVVNKYVSLGLESSTLRMHDATIKRPKPFKLVNYLTIDPLSLLERDKLTMREPLVNTLIRNGAASTIAAMGWEHEGDGSDKEKKIEFVLSVVAAMKEFERLEMEGHYKTMPALSGGMNAHKVIYEFQRNADLTDFHEIAALSLEVVNGKGDVNELIDRYNREVAGEKGGYYLPLVSDFYNMEWAIPKALSLLN